MLIVSDFQEYSTVFHAQRQQMSNGSSVTQSLLLAFTDTRELQLFLGIYLAALLGNSLIITTVAFDHHLHTPMYFFLLNLSLLNLGSISTALLKAMAIPSGTLGPSPTQGCFVFIVLSYVQIFMAVLRIPSKHGWHKTFSMCLPHMDVVSLFLITAVFAYLKPLSIFSSALDLVVAVLYSVVPPAVNALTYSMRNEELKDALKKLIQLLFCQQQ
ncbi:olfactory receptor 14A16-like [Grus japonensis]|uniref:Olfactory receptor 14A16-like n=1 Tax=Grus japonensis TaxID=30415 RepID=A0ABC9XDH7_GRUJA